MNAIGIKRGFSLIEMLLAIFILGIGIISIATLFPAGIAQQQKSTDDIIGPIVARNAMTLIRSRVDQEDFGGAEAFDARWSPELCAFTLTDIGNINPWPTICGDWMWRRPTIIKDDFGEDDDPIAVSQRGAIDFFAINDSGGFGQGDPGKSIFYISLEDDLMRIFGSESIDGIMKKFGLKEGESIDHPWINKALERAQQRVEARNFDIRKTLLKFDDTMNDQRQVIFEQRKEILKSNNVNEIINSFLEDLSISLSNEKLVYDRENQLDAFKAKIKPILGKSFKESELANIINLKKEDFISVIKNNFEEFRKKRSKVLNETANLELEKRIFLQTVDFLWRSHLQYLEHLRQVVGLRGYAQKDPLEEFKREAFKLFEDLLNKIKVDFITFLNNLEIVQTEDQKTKESNIEKKISPKGPKCLLVIKKDQKIPRNEKCPDTGKKFKHCCGAL